MEGTSWKVAPAEPRRSAIRRIGPAGSGWVVAAVLLVLLLADLGDDDEDEAGRPQAAATPGKSAVPVVPVVPRTFKGKGKKTIKVDMGTEPVLVRYSHSGSGNFVLETLKVVGSQDELLVNEVGKIKGGSSLANDGEERVNALKVRADGQWTIELLRTDDARPWNGEWIKGSGQEVLRVSTPAASMRIEHRGESNFIVTAFSNGEGTSVVNEIGDFSSEVQLPEGTELIEILHADGDWTITAGAGA